MEECEEGQRGESKIDAGEDDFGVLEVGLSECVWFRMGSSGV